MSDPGKPNGRDPNQAEPGTRREAPSWLDHAFAMTIFKDYAAKEAHREPVTLRSLAPRIRATTARTKEALPWLKLASFGDLRSDADCLRHNSNVERISGIEADYDGERMSVAEAVERLEKQGIVAMVYTSPSHTEAAPRWRVLCPTSGEMEPDRRGDMMGRLNGLFRGIFSVESWTLSQAYYFGSVKGNPAHRVELIDGTPIDEHDDLDQIWLGKPNAETRTDPDGTRRTGPTDEAALIAEITSGAAYHGPTVRLLGRWAFAGVPLLEARDRLLAAFDAVSAADRDPRWHPRRADVERCVLDIYGKEARQRDEGKRRPEPPPPEWDGPDEAEPDNDGCSDTDEDEAAEAKAKPDTKGKQPRRIETQTPAQLGEAQALPYVVKGLLARGDHAILMGHPGSGKSVIAPHIAYAVVQGRWVLGRRVRAGPVLYLACEDGKGMRNRVRALRRRYGEADGFHLVSVSVNLMVDGWQRDEIKRLISEIGPALIVVDTIGRAFPGLRENDPDDMGRVVATVRELADICDAAVLSVHHIPKDGGTTPRGHGNLGADADVTMLVEGARGDTRTVTLGKNRNGPSDLTLAFLIENTDLGTDEDGDPIKAPIAAETDASPAPTREHLTQTEAGWLRDLQAIAAEPDASELRQVPDLSETGTALGPMVVAMTRDRVRQGLRQRGRFAAEPNANLTSADRVRLHAMLNALKDKGKIGLGAELVWLL